MKTTVLNQNEVQVFLPAGKNISIVTDAAGTALVHRYLESELLNKASVARGTTSVFGEYLIGVTIKIVCLTGSLTYELNQYTGNRIADLTDVDAFQPVMTNDVKELIGDGAPVDYTDGTPPATGEGVAGPGSRYTDITGAKLYINGGTKAQPVWKIVTSAA